MLFPNAMAHHRIGKLKSRLSVVEIFFSPCVIGGCYIIFPCCMSETIHQNAKLADF